MKLSDKNFNELLKMASNKNIKGRSKMKKADLILALSHKGSGQPFSKPINVAENNERNEEYDRMANLEELISLTTQKNLSMNPEDIELVKCSFNTNKPNSVKRCQKCRKCGAVSGTAGLTPRSHYNNCVYKINNVYGPFVVGERKKIHKNSLNPEITESILQHEYGINSSASNKKILGTFGALPCFIVAIRDPTTTRTILTHIDSRSDDLHDIFQGFNPTNSDVYIVGGNSSSMQQINDFLLMMRSLGFGIKFAHLIDPNSNSFAINSENGNTFLNDEVVPSNLRLSINPEDRRISFHKFLPIRSAIAPFPLNRVDVI